MTNDPAGGLALGVGLAALSACLTVLVLKGKYGMLLIGLLVRVCLIVGAIRLGKPDSPWARALYDPARLDEAARRFPDRTRPPDPLPAPAPARQMRYAMGLLVAGVALTVVTPAAGVAAGPALVIARLVLAGAAWARTSVLVLAGVALGLSLLPPPASAVPVAVLVVRAVLIGAGTLALLHSPRGDHAEAHHPSVSDTPMSGTQ